MSVLSQVIHGGGAPRRVTAYSSGTGTYTPVAANSRVLAFIAAGGAGGKGEYPYASYGYSQGGGGGSTTITAFRIAAPVSYVVGSGGAGINYGGGASYGSASTFANRVSNPGHGQSGGLALEGAGVSGGNQNTNSVCRAGTGNPAGGGSYFGVGGNAGNPGSAGGIGAGGGGSTLIYGVNTVGGAGGSGYIEIWDFGA